MIKDHSVHIWDKCGIQYGVYLGGDVMLLSLELISYGDCKDMISFYLNTFVNASAEIHLYREMP